MKTMGISKFKTHALKILDEVAKTQEIIVITKRGNSSVIIKIDIFLMNMYSISVHNIWRQIWLFKLHIPMPVRGWLLY